MYPQAVKKQSKKMKIEGIFLILLSIIISSTGVNAILTRNVNDIFYGNITANGEELIYGENPYCHGESVTTLFNKYDNQMLPKVMKVIEFMASVQTLSAERNAIIGGSYTELMESKGKIGQIISSLNQRTLM